MLMFSKNIHNHSTPIFFFFQPAVHLLNPFGAWVFAGLHIKNLFLEEAGAEKRHIEMDVNLWRGKGGFLTVRLTGSVRLNDVE